MEASAPTQDARQKVDHEVVVQEKKDGMTAKAIAEKHGVAIGTIYKILRDNGQGTGRTVSRGVNVAGDLDAMIARLQGRADSVKGDLDAENERHKLAVEQIKAEAEKAKAILEQVKSVRDSLTNGDKS